MRLSRAAVRRSRTRNGGQSIARWVSLIVVLALVAGCGSDGADSTTTTGSSGGTGASDEPVNLSVWFNREHYGEIDVAGFEARYPNISVDITIEPDDAIFFILQRMYQAGEPLPDMTQIDSFFATPLYDAGMIIPMTDLVSQWEEEDPDNYAKQVDALFLKADDGNIIGLTPIGDMDMIYYRADWFNDAGISIPFDSWEGVLDAARAIKQSQPDAIPVALAAADMPNAAVSIMSAMGVPFDGEIPQLDNDAGREWISFFQTLAKEELIDPASGAWGEDESRGALIAGKAAILFEGTKTGSDFVDTIPVPPGDGWSVALMPLGADGTRVTSTRSMHITSTSEHPYESMLLLRYMMETDNVLAHTAKSSVLYLQAEALASPEYADLLSYIPSDIIPVIGTADHFPQGLGFAAMQDVLKELIPDLLVNADASPDDMIAKWQPELDAAAQQ